LTFEFRANEWFFVAFDLAFEGLSILARNSVREHSHDYSSP